MLILSGLSGSGKTSACLLVAKALTESGTPAGGVLCKAVFEGGVKTAISCLDIGQEPGGEPWLLASLDPLHIHGLKPGQFSDTEASVMRFGKWQFIKAGLSRADEAVIRYLKRIALDGTDRAMVFVDEIGPLELEHNSGMRMTLSRLDAQAREEYRGHSDYIVVARPDIASRLASRWPNAMVLDMDGMSITKAALEISRLMLL